MINCRVRLVSGSLQPTPVDAAPHRCADDQTQEAAGASADTHDAEARQHPKRAQRTQLGAAIAKERHRVEEAAAAQHHPAAHGGRSGRAGGLMQKVKSGQKVKQKTWSGN